MADIGVLVKKVALAYHRGTFLVEILIIFHICNQEIIKKSVVNVMHSNPHKNVSLRDKRDR